MKGAFALTLLFVLATTASASNNDSPQVLEWDKEIAASGQTFDVKMENLRQVVPSDGLPAEVEPELSNNCIAIEQFDGRYFLAWRSGPYHFASDKTKIYIISSNDTVSWQHEHTIFLDRDMREPFFLPFNGTLIFSFFSAGTDPIAFQPHLLLHIRREGNGQWSDPEPWGAPTEIAWQIRERDGRAYATSYRGNHYGVTTPDVRVFFNVSDDGWNWAPMQEDHSVMYEGGVNEVGWTFDLEGNFWGVLRNEDGDKSGFGSRIAYADKDQLYNWQFFPANASDPRIFESSRMFRHGDDLYLVARRDVDGKYDWGGDWDKLPFEVKRALFMGSYSLRPHTTSLWKINKKSNPIQLEFVMDLFGDGDTTFPSIVRVGMHKFLIANYSSPLKHKSWSWIHGQLSKEGTQVFFVELNFVPTA
mmetsp:Transcript_47271/g.122166  ORF Transcript_47271/g.122166 Transcript_47271/m.122166 type:complete len:417 (-) Transcript_47271:2071-3321(-)|eukprot:CAMPEP_0113875712 /NCGR_PEP_ID=MMETSP0780_2-20120614/5092_1 /TAXON_ID=652834 /ORGANISM="Palpitomonas bilix" /LENGTH=416 /DNA_ID=CAMNT_0000861727 /DNA_START=22 /DNA_END=1272 /DNA_ORIENTATION=- /assembly_acc=CAM_ASM_000599